MGEQQEPIVIYSTFGELENAKDVAHRIIRARLGACVNIVPNIVSVYEWEGAVHEDDEMVMIVKSSKSRQAELIEMIKHHHSYDEPAIMVVPVIGGSASYLKWAAGQISEDET